MTNLIDLEYSILSQLWSLSLSNLFLSFVLVVSIFSIIISVIVNTYRK